MINQWMKRFAAKFPGLNYFQCMGLACMKVTGLELTEKRAKDLGLKSEEIDDVRKMLVGDSE